MARTKVTAELAAELGFGARPALHTGSGSAQQPLTDLGPPCPSCGAIEARYVISVAGDQRQLVTTYKCRVCPAAEWERRIERKDLCIHDRWLGVPCEDCGRTWGTIEAAALHCLGCGGTGVNQLGKECLTCRGGGRARVNGVLSAPGGVR